MNLIVVLRISITLYSRDFVNAFFDTRFLVASEERDITRGHARPRGATRRTCRHNDTHGVGSGTTGSICFAIAKVETAASAVR